MTRKASPPMTLDQLPGALPDARLLSFEPLEVVHVDDLGPGLVKTIVGLPVQLVLAPVRVVRALLRRPKLLVALLVAGVVAAVIVSKVRADQTTPTTD